MRVIRHLVILVCALVLVAFAAVVIAPAQTLPYLLPACETEDAGPTGLAAACFWDAAERGNHLGTSFARYSDGTVIYLDKTP